MLPKASLTQATTLGAANPANGPSDNTASTGALAATKATAVAGVFYIKFLGTGVAQYSTEDSSYTNWADPTSGQTSNTVYFGIENNSADGEAKSGLATTYDFTLTPSVE